MRQRLHAPALACLLIGLAATSAFAGATPKTSEVEAGEFTTQLDSSWRGRVQAALAKLEYHARAESTGVHAPNRAQSLHTFFDPSGIRVHDWTDARAPLIQLSLARSGRGDDLAVVATGDVRRDANRVEIVRPGIVEWFVNSAAGLEHGATLAERPTGDGPLVLELAVSHAKAAKRGDGVVFATGSGRRLAYDHLVVLDATGARVPAKMVVADAEHVRLEVEDHDVPYPLTVDPLLSAIADTVLDSDDLALGLGVSLDGAGDVNGDGYADVIVGAHNWAGGIVFGGAAFVFHGGPGGLGSGPTALPATRIDGDALTDRFASSVAGAGDVNGDGYADVVVAAPRSSDGELEEGIVYVYHGGPGGIPDGDPSTADAVLESNVSSVRFGHSVDGAGDVNGDGYSDVIVGAPLWGLPGFAESGAAFVFHGSPTGIVSGGPAAADTIFVSHQHGGELGTSVSRAGDVNGDGFDDVIVGAPLYDLISTSGAGAAFVFLGGLTGIADAEVSNAASRLYGDIDFASLGERVADGGDLDGDGFAEVVIASHRWAYVFHGGVGGVATVGYPSTADAKIEVFDGTQFNGNAAWSVDAIGDANGDGFGDLIIGSRGYSAGENQEGVAWLLLGAPSGVVSGGPGDVDLQIESDQAGAWFGHSVAGVGDVDGDGFGDVLVGSLRYEHDVGEDGATFLYRGSGEVGTSARLQQFRIGAGDGPVEAGAAVFGTDRFGIRSFVDGTMAPGRAKLEVELCGAGIAFGDPQCTTTISEAWVDLASEGTELDHAVTGLPSDERYSWRARVLHTATMSGEPASSTPGLWRRLQGRATSGDIRFVPEPGFGVSIVVLALGLVAAPRRGSLG